MRNYMMKVYLKAPYFIKRFIANVEAIRRDYYRRNRKYRKIIKEIDLVAEMTSQRDKYFDSEKIKTLLNDISVNVKYYAFLKEKNIDSVEEFKKIPILRKQDVRENINELISLKVNNSKSLWRGSSSGSTGTPLKYFRDKKSVSINQYLNEEYYRLCGFDLNEKRVRISGVKVAEFNKKTPPYWLYIDKYKQLQCSAYHISKNTYKDYLKKIQKIDAKYGTGFPSAWTALAEQVLENNVKFDQLKVIVLDSEGITKENQLKIEKAFNCKVYKTYGLGEVGMCAIGCSNNNYHLLSSHYIEVVKDNGDHAGFGEVGEIVVTDYNSNDFPFVRYATGDLGILNNDECGCGMQSPYLSKIVGRVEDYILTKDGRKITRVSMLMEPAVGIKESQIIQLNRDEILIRIVPDSNFESDSMSEVIRKSKEFLDDMRISWESVDQLERMPSGKVKFLIRKY